MDLNACQLQVRFVLLSADRHGAEKKSKWSPCGWGAVRACLWGMPYDSGNDEHDCQAQRCHEAGEGACGHWKSCVSYRDELEMNDEEKVGVWRCGAGLHA